MEATTIVNMGQLRLKASLDIGGNGIYASGTNSKIGISWGFYADGFEDLPPGGLPNYVVDVAEVKGLMGSEEIPVDISTGVRSPASRTIRYMSNHFTHGQIVNVTLKVKFSVNFFPFEVQDSSEVKIYNIGSGARTLENATALPPDESPLSDIISDFASAKHKTLAIDYNFIGTVKNSTPFVGAFNYSNLDNLITNGTAFYVESHGNPKVFSDNLQTKVSQAQVVQMRANAYFLGLPPMNIVHLDCCNTGNQFYGSGTPLDMNNAFLFPYDDSTPIVDRCFCSWGVSSYRWWHLIFTPVMWENLTSGKTAFLSRRKGFQALLTFLDIDLDDLPGSLIGLSNQGQFKVRAALVNELVKAQGDYSQIFKIWGDQDTTFNSLYVNPNSTIWYEVQG